MSLHPVRSTSVLAVLLAGGVLAAAPAAARETPPLVPIPLPPLLACTTPWTNVIVGTDGADQLLGTSANDLIIGLGGDDTIYGDAGRDTILGGDGDDLLAGGPDDDCIIGGAGADHSVLWVFSVPNGNDDDHSVAYLYQY